ncbi:hypothetical protein PV08_07841 [Exophiala spinifera]|uniref:Uncharacterized protein n=1 Tax=Exophiala spinifera TaxID=91928 RepID=A0A0D2BV13_9EURO|nr:uncharacterized protein PV08_07841 [Exophiala spinifera]KIW15054.1 hypothetical protein PV08_07841 [Exophiala spinifera]
MLESQQAQLVAGLQELYKRVQNGQGWTGPALKETSNGTPLTHDILERLGALKQDGNTTTHDTFEEDLNTLQQRLIADGAGFMQRQPSHDSHTHSDSSAPSPIYEPVAHRPTSTTTTTTFSNPFNLNQLPPTPPNQSPYPQTARAVQLPTKSQTYPHATNIHSNLSWATPVSVSEFDDSMDFMTQFESSPMTMTVDQGCPSLSSSSSLQDLSLSSASSFQQPMFQEQQQMMMPAAINPCLTMKDWPNQDDFQRYFNPTMLA